MIFDSLLDDLRHNFFEFKDESWVVPNSIPILFFGDVKRYQDSNTKIVTVALNPSDKEFSEHRFETGQDVISNNTRYIQTLSNYFVNKPYCTWFNNFEKLLQHLDASYYGDTYPNSCRSGNLIWSSRSNCVLHTDIFSPIATSKTWSNLTEDQKERLQNGGFKIWENLMGILEPDIILLSGGEYLCKSIKCEWKPITLSSKFDQTHKMQMAKYKTSNVFWISGKNTPISMRDADLSDIAEYIKINL